LKIECKNVWQKSKDKYNFKKNVKKLSKSCQKVVIKLSKRCKKLKILKRTGEGGEEGEGEKEGDL
jgi:azurin